MSISARFPHIYDNRLLDRASLLRNDAQWLQRQREEPNSLVIAMNSLKVHVDLGGDRPTMRKMRVGELNRHLDDHAIFLGMLDGTPLFAFDAEGNCPFDDDEPVEIRAIGKDMDAGEAGILAYARAIFHWHRGHRFCGSCGHETIITQGGHARRCERCGHLVFPRTDPAVIVLVIHEDHCLLGRSARFPGNMYSTLAGFVEPGESLEHCLRREIHEEAGVEIVDWQYRSSQPWPFPQSLMLGFRATASDRRLTIDQDELEDAIWIDRETLKDPDKRTISLPNEDSIARALIEDWLEEVP